MYEIMTPGPTQVRENVRLARSQVFTNPDLDRDFYDFYRETCRLLSASMHTENEAFILGGEGILGLEAACASLTEPGDRVLVIDNGIFGKGFADFVKIYGGIPVCYTADYRRGIDLSELKKYLEKDHGFKYATVVHCDTPSGVLNDVEAISRLLDSYGILTVVDSVAGMFGESLDLSVSSIDILCGGSQKALSAPPGLTMVWVSPRAFGIMENRRTPIASFYANLLVFKDYYKNLWFPYTMPISDIMGLRAALDNYMSDTGIHMRHRSIAEACRNALTKAGMSLYLNADWASTVTAMNVPDGVTDQQILDGMKKDYGIMIAGSFDILAGKVIRIGHMGENAYPDKVASVLEALQGTLEKLNVPVKGNMKELFLSALSDGKI